MVSTFSCAFWVFVHLLQRNDYSRNSHCGAVLTNPTSIHKGCWFDPWPFSVGKSCNAGCRCGSDLALLCLWCRLAAVALIRPLAWELPICHRCSHKTPTKKEGDRERDAYSSPLPILKSVLIIHEVYFSSFFFFLQGPPAAKGFIRATAASHSHSHTRSKLRLQPAPQLTAMLAL